MKRSIKSYFPVEANVSSEITSILAGIGTAVIVSLDYFNDLYNHLKSLYINHEIKPENLIPDRKMIDFTWIVKGKLAGFYIFIVAMLLLTVYHYRLHYTSSKSIYTMRRLPQRSELHKRCLTVPLLAIVVSTATAILLFWMFYQYYLFVTPKGAITPGQLDYLFNQSI